MQKTENIKRQQLKCPCCGRRILDSSLSIKSKLFDMETTTEFFVDYIDKCKKCGKEIGIQKV